MGLFSRKPKNPMLEKSLAQTRQEFQELKNKYELLCDHEAYYQGGIPGFWDAFKDRGVSITVFDSGLYFSFGPDLSTDYRHYKYFLLIKDLINCSVNTISQIKKDVTLPRVLVLGVLSLAAQKKTVTGTNYLILNFMDKGQECHAIFSDDITHGMINELARKINKAKKQYLDSPQAIKDAQEAEAKQKEPPAASVAEAKPVDIPGQIEKLADLLKKGILTEEEFSSKKAELLARI